jgi:hypothetical protein
MNNELVSIAFFFENSFTNCYHILYLIIYLILAFNAI